MRAGWIGLLLALVVVASLAADLDETRFRTGSIPDPVVLLPDQEAVAEIVLLSGGEGWGQDDDRMAATLRDKGAIVIGIDQPAWLASLAEEERDCAYLVSSLESLGKQIQRRLGEGRFQAPIIAGRGAGGALALAIAAQTPDATVEKTVAVDPESFLRLEKPLCTPADKERVAGGIRYGLPEKGLTNPVLIRLTQPGSDAPLVKRGPLPDLTVEMAQGDADGVLLASLLAEIDAMGASSAHLPLAVLNAEGSDRRALAIIISGDGGWRDIDKQIASYLQQAGISSVGLDALRYFWKERSPAETAAAIQSIIDTHAAPESMPDILLIGYSFGANVLPATFLAMGDEYRQRVRLVSLLSIERKADFQVSVLGWAGKEAEGRGGDPIAAARAIDPSILQCIYGAEDDKSGCPGLEATGAEILRLAGGHHFDGDYAALTQKIIAPYDRLLVD